MAEYVIRIINDTQRSQKRAIANSGGGNNQDTTPQKDKDSDSTSKALVKGYVAYKHYVSPFVKQAISYQIGTVALNTGRVEEQQKLQFAYNVGSKALSLAESVAIGAMVGNVGGAIVGGTVSLVTMGVSFVQKYETLAKQRSLEDITLGLQNARAGGSPSAYNGSRS